MHVFPSNVFYCTANDLDVTHTAQNYSVMLYFFAFFIQGPEVIFTCPDLNFNLVRFRELKGYEHITIKNISNISAEWSLRESPECVQVMTKEYSLLM